MTRVLVTGSAGFIGGYVVEELLERGYEVVGVDNEFEIRARRPILRQPSGIQTYSRRCTRCRPHERRAGWVRPPDRRGGDDRRDLVLPCICIRFARHQRANPRGHVRRGDTSAPRRLFEQGHLSQLVDGVRIGDDVAISRRPGARGPTAEIVVWLSEARGRVLRSSGSQQHDLPYTIVRPFNCVGVGEGRRSATWRS